MACTDELKVAPFTSQSQVTPGRQRNWGHRDKLWEPAAKTGTEVQAGRALPVPKNISEFSSKMYIPAMAHWEEQFHTLSFSYSSHTDMALNSAHLCSFYRHLETPSSHPSQMFPDRASEQVLLQKQTGGNTSVLGFLLWGLVGQMEPRL